MMNKKELIDKEPCLIISITNRSTDSIDDVLIFDTKSESSEFNKDLSVEVENFDITYNDLIEYLKTNPINVIGTTFYSCNTSQLFQLAQAKTFKGIVNINPSIEEYEYGVVMKCKHEPYVLMRGDSMIRIKKILGSSILKIYLKK